MIFIFGVFPKIKELGETEERECPHCHNINAWRICRQTYWLNLFFINVLPLKKKFFAACPICRYSVKLENPG